MKKPTSALYLCKKGGTGGGIIILVIYKLRVLKNPIDICKQTLLQNKMRSLFYKGQLTNAHGNQLNQSNF